MENGDEIACSQELLQESKQVLDEGGALVDVIFDPVLKCYYEPKRHIYYQVKDVVIETPR
jgi:hypothetical protein